MRFVTRSAELGFLPSSTFIQKPFTSQERSRGLPKRTETFSRSIKGRDVSFEQSISLFSKVQMKTRRRDLQMLPAGIPSSRFHLLREGVRNDKEKLRKFKRT